jgi:hypothetical protein
VALPFLIFHGGDVREVDNHLEVHEEADGVSRLEGEVVAPEERGN